MKKPLGFLALMVVTIFVGGCTLNPAAKDDINYSSSLNEESAEVDADAQVEGTVNANTNNANTNIEANANVAGTLSANAKVLNVMAADSEAKYSLNEVLSGVPTLVVGTSKQLSGQITVDTSVKPAIVSIGEIRLDATSFKTDKAMRDNNVIKLILKSDEPENKFIVFQSAKVSGVPETLTPDQSFPVEITGNLTISGVMKPTTFKGTMTWKSDGTLTGTASTDLTYANFGLVIPNLPFLANVDEVVKLEVNLSAK
jgi:polyisoprenoid-binding protein YceI